MEAVCVHRIVRSGTSWRCLWTALYAGLLLACPDSLRGENPTAVPEGAAEQRRSEETGLSAVEQDWLRQAEALDALRRGVPRGSAVTTQGDAAGAVDGIKDGKYAFHTNQQPGPWWQVDFRPGPDLRAGRRIQPSGLCTGITQRRHADPDDLGKRPHLDASL